MLKSTGSDKSPTRRAIMRRELPVRANSTAMRARSPKPIVICAIWLQVARQANRNTHARLQSRVLRQVKSHDVHGEEHQRGHDVRHQEAREIGGAGKRDQQGDENQEGRHRPAAIKPAKQEKHPGEDQRLREHGVPDEPVHVGEQQEQAVERAPVKLRRQHQIIAGIRIEKWKAVENAGMRKAIDAATITATSVRLQFRRPLRGGAPISAG